MECVKLGYKFYFIFALILITPATIVAGVISTFVETLPTDGIIGYLSSVGFFDAPTALIILFLLFWSFSNHLWKIKHVDTLLGIPNINGRYEGELVSSHTEDKTQNGTYPIVIEVKQTLTDIQVFLYTERSCSYSLIASMCKNYTKNFELVYVYQNKTSAMHADADMRDHHGSAFLELANGGNTLNGYYFNNPRERGRYGNIKVTRVSRKQKGGF